jgi:heme-degrading monooxygenase HmoA
MRDELTFVSRSEITVPPGEMAALERAFQARARLVDAHPGFLGLELLRDARENGRYVLLTRWRSRADFGAYMKSGDHARAHQRVHEGLTPTSGSGGLEQFHVVLDVRGGVSQGAGRPLRDASRARAGVQDGTD